VVVGEVDEPFDAIAALVEYPSARA